MLGHLRVGSGFEAFCLRTATHTKHHRRESWFAPCRCVITPSGYTPKRRELRIHSDPGEPASCLQTRFLFGTTESPTLSIHGNSEPQRRLCQTKRLPMSDRSPMTAGGTGESRSPGCKTGHDAAEHRMFHFAGRKGGVALETQVDLSVCMAFFLPPPPTCYKTPEDLGAVRDEMLTELKCRHFITEQAPATLVYLLKSLFTCRLFFRLDAGEMLTRSLQAVLHKCSIASSRAEA
ncbi:hypothetical protein JZ751_019826 [Albula glossodonta]|uniref:Uncharacterized protein n=1 Tax=Albula glossodonta TaxID=121402 RepID=A0A8T2NU02_9TELE|nr:hypothetical protein JZ751_019826 [Albula glossodonta]